MHGSVRYRTQGQTFFMYATAQTLPERMASLGPSIGYVAVEVQTKELR
jgi:hypothetical protein